MKYNFDKIIDRRGTASLKWDVTKEGELPMWVADMDFAAAPAIREALEKRLQHGVFGYNIIPDEWYDAYIQWWERRHQLRISREMLLFSTGVIPSLAAIIRAMTAEGDSVLVQSPVYNAFYHIIHDAGRTVVENRLLYKNGVYTMDFDDLEKKLKAPSTTMMVLCNPQNPTGNIWTKRELARIAKLCRDNNVFVVSDEIHCDITVPGTAYTPFLTVGEDAEVNSVTLVAPTKCFNLAGLQTSAVIAADRDICKRVKEALSLGQCSMPNTFSVTAAMAAFNESAEWLDEMNAYIAQNKQTVYQYLAESLPAVKAVKSDATYLLWLDCTAYGLSGEALFTHIRKESGLFVLAGEEYGSGGEGFLRLNVACPRALLQDGLSRLKASLDNL